MKITPRILVAAVLVVLGANANAAGVSGIDVAVKRDGKTVARARTDASGNFATGNLEPGSYNVEFRAPSALKGQLALSVAAGKQAPRQAKASGKHLGGGVAISVEVPKASRLTGTVAQGGAEVAENTKVPEGYEKVKANVKVINGKRHVWVPGPIGSNMGGRWVEEGSEAAALSTSNKKDGDAAVLRHIQDQSSNVGRRGE